MWIKVAYLCEKIGCLPQAGGLFDQDAVTVDRLDKTYRAIAKYEKEQIEAAKHKAD